jgi:hypothetical protein
VVKANDKFTGHFVDDKIDTSDHFGELEDPEDNVVIVEYDLLKKFNIGMFKVKDGEDIYTYHIELGEVKKR